MLRTSFVAAFGLLAAAACLYGDDPSAPARSGGDVVLVEVNGVKLSLADLERKRAAALFPARSTYYDAERKAIEQFVDDYLLEKQAAKEGLTVDALLEKHVNSTLPKDPSDEALRVYYEGVDTTESYDSVRPKIIDALRQRRIAKAKTAYMQSLRSQASIILRLPPPRAPISMKDVPVRGAANAKITVLEYADYECPYCQQIQPTLSKLEAEFKGKIAFAFKDFPLSMHANAQPAAEAAHCAGAQGKYWEYHDLVFASKAVDAAALGNYATQLKLDKAAFDKCVSSGQMKARVNAQATEAQDLGIQGTPTLFVNGRSVSGQMTYEKIRSVIEEELSATDNTPVASAHAGAASPSRN